MTNGKEKKIQDLWEMKDPQYPSYPTEKNIEMIERIILSSSLPNSWGMDAFAGSGTAAVAAQKHGRKWILIDNSPEAVKVIRSRPELHSPELSLFRAADSQGYQFLQTLPVPAR